MDCGICPMFRNLDCEVKIKNIEGCFNLLNKEVINLRNELNEIPSKCANNSGLKMIIDKMIIERLQVYHESKVLQTVFEKMGAKNHLINLNSEIAMMDEFIQDLRKLQEILDK